MRRQCQVLLTKRSPDPALQSLARRSRLARSLQQPECDTRRTTTNTSLTSATPRHPPFAPPQLAPQAFSPSISFPHSPSFRAHQPHPGTRTAPSSRERHIRQPMQIATGISQDQVGQDQASRIRHHCRTATLSYRVLQCPMRILQIIYARIIQRFKEL